MHIRETKDEKLDYELFMTEGLPDDAGHGEYTQALGRRTWSLMHGLADHYGCGSCKGAFQMLVGGMHDTVSIHLDKGVWDPSNYRTFVKAVNEGYHKWQHGGKPVRQESPKVHSCKACTVVPSIPVARV